VVLEVVVVQEVVVVEVEEEAVGVEVVVEVAA
jgi:hypothetical protein